MESEQRKNAIRGAYHLTGSNNFYDGLITCSTFSGKAVFDDRKQSFVADPVYPGFENRPVLEPHRQHNGGWRVRVPWLVAHDPVQVASVALARIV